MTSKSKQLTFLILAIVGISVTWYFNIKFMMQMGGFSLSEFVSATLVNYASASISYDLMVLTATVLFWSFLEARRLGMRFWWAYFVLTFTIAIAFAFPLFMYFREKALQRQQIPEAA